MASANPEMTRQHEGSLRHQKHLMAQREQYRINHLSRGPRDKRKPLVHFGNGLIPFEKSPCKVHVPEIPCSCPPAYRQQIPVRVQDVTCGDCRVLMWRVSKAMNDLSLGLRNLDLDAEKAAKEALKV